MFDTVLIANRGEIACRVIRTCRRLGIRTAAVYSEADAGAPHVHLADVALPIGPPPARESYLDADRILQAAKRARADALHPGYGFLSENAAFAEACAAAGIRFVGPPAAAIRAMGMKDEAKRRMEAAGVPVVPGFHEPEPDAARLSAEAERLGYPLLVKAVAGGGGKGMRRVESAEALEAALAAARREAEAAFGHPGLLIERWIERPRHVEVQVFADDHGQVVHLFERDCSLQRRHQKVVEEAPAPGLADALRERLGDAAVRAARAIDYRGAGTIEFILDASGPLAEAPFYFMEMNTRLQVEHPVTEAITGTDLVEWQLRVAAGEPLPLGQDAIRRTGHAIEVRVYAEDPARGYLPQTGTLVRHRPPAEDAHVRVDAGVAEGDAIGIHYDPMIAKLIVHDADRSSAIRRLRGAIADYAIAGLDTNLAMLHAVTGLPAFARGDVHTGFLEEYATQVAPRADGPPVEAVALVCAALLVDRAGTAWPAEGPDPWSPWSATDGFRLHADGLDTFHLRFGREGVDVTAHHSRGCTTLEWRDRGAVVRDARRDGDRVTAVVDGARIHADVIDAGHVIHVVRGPATLRFERIFDDEAVDEGGASGGLVRAPVPGRITAVLVAEGEAVAADQPLVRLEAMKMEHTLEAPAAGTVSRLSAAVGQQVDEGETLLVVD
jgi:3-methylcrotonyl-CoA carboxylase alpha subunit